jgi:hypothetical protein
MFLITELLGLSPSASFPPMHSFTGFIGNLALLFPHGRSLRTAYVHVFQDGVYRLVAKCLIYSQALNHRLYRKSCALDRKEMRSCISFTGFAAHHYRSRLLGHGLRFLVNQACLAAAETVRQSLSP